MREMKHPSSPIRRPLLQTQSHSNNRNPLNDRDVLKPRRDRPLLASNNHYLSARAALL